VICSAKATEPVKHFEESRTDYEDITRKNAAAMGNLRALKAIAVDNYLVAYQAPKRRSTCYDVESNSDGQKRET